VLKAARGRAALLRRLSFGMMIDHLANGGGEIVYPGARHNDRVATAVGFFGNAEESSTVIFPELDVKMLPFDLQFPGLDDIVHFS